MRRPVGPIGFRGIAVAGLRFGGAGVLLAALLVAARVALECFVAAAKLPQAGAHLLVVGASLPTYVLFAGLLGAAEVGEVINIV